MPEIRVLGQTKYKLRQVLVGQILKTLCPTFAINFNGWNFSAIIRADGIFHAVKLLLGAFFSFLEYASQLIRRTEHPE